MYNSLYPQLRSCDKLLVHIESINNLLKIDTDDYSYFKQRKEESIKNTDLRNYLEYNSFDLCNRLKMIDDEIVKVNKVLEWKFGNYECSLDNKYNNLWKRHLTEEIQDTSSILNDIENVYQKIKEWKVYLDEEEDRGSTSTYSDYSGSDTETTEDNEEEEEVSRS